MSEKKILVFEDEWETIRGSFDLANLYAFNNELKFLQVAKSQNVSFSQWSDIYAAVFVDITLAKKTEMDGFNIVKTIKDRNLIDLNKVIVMTGNSKVKEKLKEMGFKDDEIRVLYKPVAFDEIARVLKGIV